MREEADNFFGVPPRMALKTAPFLQPQSAQDAQDAFLTRFRTVDAALKA
jgi:hypothetical protein